MKARRYMKPLRMPTKRRRTAYELSQSQVSTPADVVRLFWTLTHAARPQLNDVLDLGAGDGRFSEGGNYSTYTGIEIDPKRLSSRDMRGHGRRMIQGCAFLHDDENYDACVGNPPYVRHHDIESPWKEKTVDRIERDLGLRLNMQCNLFLYFMCLGFLQTHSDGLVSFVIPYEWISRPSASPVRRFIREQGWNVNIYRFTYPVFAGVLTTASVTVIDKSTTLGEWNLYDISRDGMVSPCSNRLGTAKELLGHERRGVAWAMRGLSPGSQKIFCLTEGERVHHGLRHSDVMPCVASLRNIPDDAKVLTTAVFQKYLVAAGERCWLIRSDRNNLSHRLKKYLSGIPHKIRGNYTCSKRPQWFKYNPHPTPNILVSSGFVSFGPKILGNLIGAQPVGVVTGVYCRSNSQSAKVHRYLRETNFEDKVVAHAKTLKKVEVGQLNAALNSLLH